jgi:hypothetical protein
LTSIYLLARSIIDAEIMERAVPFVKGESGNPAGRPPGARNTRTLLCEAFLENQAEGLTRTLVNMANGGDSTALRLAIDRILPRGASRPILFPLPRVDSAKAARQAVADVIQGMTTAQLAPRDGNEMLRVIERGAKIIATAEAAEAVAREGQPRHVQVSWVDGKEFSVKWKAYWKEQYEALYGRLPELPEPEGDSWLPPEKEPAADAPGGPADDGGSPPDRNGDPPLPPTPGGPKGVKNNGNNENTMDATRPAGGDPNVLTDKAGARRQGDEPLLSSAPGAAKRVENNGNNENNENTMDEPQSARGATRYRDPPRNARSTHVADDGLVPRALRGVLRVWRHLAGDWPVIGAARAAPAPA